LLHSRLTHTPLAWTTARVTRSTKTAELAVPAGTFEVTTFTIEAEDKRRIAFAIEVAPPHRLVRQTGANGEELALTGSKRMAYWRLNAPGGEKHLEEIGLGGD
jgi:hypothetical protein